MADENATEALIVELTEHGVLVLTMNDPATRNAMGADMQLALRAQLQRAEHDDAVRAVVLTGAAGAFCSGANVKGFAKRIEDDTTAASGPSAWERLDPTYAAQEQFVDRATASIAPELVRRLHALSKPTIAAVDGTAYGLGCGLALACDFRVVSSGAKLAEAFARHGLIAGDGSTWFLPRLVGEAKAKWLLFTGEPVLADEALRIGMVDRLSDDESARADALEMATTLAKGPGLALGMIKQLVNRSGQEELAEHYRVVVRAQEIARASDDHKEGVAAFKEKREPRFTGR